MILLGIFPFILNAQIAITEVYYDTPFSETKENTNLHHSGEYIELFNYTTEDINIGGWILADEDGSFIFPNNTIIQSDKAILVAYIPAGATYPFIPSLFPTIQGQEEESRVIYQNKIVLNNYKEELSLYMTSIRGIILPRHQIIHNVKVQFPDNLNSYNPYSINKWDNSTMNSNGGYNTNYDFYKKSLQINTQEEFQNNILINTQGQLSTSKYRTATPLELDFPYELVPLESIGAVIDAILNNYDHFIGNSGVLDLLNNFCDKYVALISENVISHSIISERCSEYDEAGNFIGLLDTCPQSRQEENEEPEELLAQEDFSSKVWVAPNPTRSKTTIFWEKDIEDLIAEIIVVPVNGGQHIPITYAKIEASADVNLATYPSGIYVVRFTFTSGQTVTKSIIKI